MIFLLWTDIDKKSKIKTLNKRRKKKKEKERIKKEIKNKEGGGKEGRGQEEKEEGDIRGELIK